MTPETDDGDTTIETVQIRDDDSEAYLNAHEFVDLLRSLDRAVQTIDELQAEVATLNTGLDEEDAIRLIYGRTQFSLSTVRKFFDTFDTIEGADNRKLLKRLLADLGNERLEESNEFLSEVERLREKYGDLEVETDG